MRDLICEELRMEETKDLGMYLGVPTINGRTSKREYQYLLDHINNKLAGWKSKVISPAGRATLVQSSISSMPYYAMQTTKLPRSTCDDMDKVARRFLWGGTEEQRKIYLVSWEQVTKETVNGGLGIRSMRQANSAFLTKLGWRVIAEPNTLWSQVLRHKYCDGRCDLDIFKHKQGSSNAWRGIVDNVDILRKGVSMEVGNRQCTFFWNHNWTDKRSLLKLATTKPPLDLQDRTVHEMWEPNHGWKWEEFAEFLLPKILQQIDSYELVDDEEAVDRVFWNGTTMGKFTVKSALRIVRGELEMGATKNCSRVWKLPISQRI